MAAEDINKMIDDKLKSFSNMTVPQHRHNKVDSPAIAMGDLILDTRGLIFPFSDGKILLNTSSDTNFGLNGVSFSPSNPSFDFYIGDVSGPVFDTIELNANNAISSDIISKIIVLTYTGLIGSLNVNDIITDGTGSGIITFFDGTTIQVTLTTVAGIGGSFTTSGGATGTITSTEQSFSFVTQTAGSITTQFGDGLGNTLNMVNSSVGIQFSTFGTINFSIQLPDTIRPAPVAGMIAFEAGTFYVCKVTGTWIPLI